eukprot:1469119-Ditylum_brightwellii.AAC.1
MAQVPSNSDRDKCAQFHTSTTSKRQPHKALVYSFIKDHIEVVQTKIANLLKTLSTQHVDLFSRAFQKRKQLERLIGIEDLIPKLALTEFNFHITDAAKQSKEFAALLEATYEIFTQCCKDLKAKILAAIKIKVKILQKDIQSNYIKVI